jgi:hypothetical protein
MNKKVGLWIDHKQAIIVAITGKGQEIGLIVSKAKKQGRSSAASMGKGSHEPQPVTADDIRQRVFTEHLNIYYDTVIAAIGDAEAILLFGPGEAKGELKRRLERNKMGERIAGVEAVDKMTHGQIAAKVRKHFAGLR